MNLRIDNPGNGHQMRRIDDLLGLAVGQISDRRDLSIENSDVALHRSGAGSQMAALNEKIESHIRL